MGEDVADTGGIFQVSKGLLERFGRERVRDTPISEATFCGAGVGAAIAGMRPIVEVQIFDFVTLMMDMLVNQAAKFRYMLGGAPRCRWCARAAGRRHPARGPAQPEPGGLVCARAGPGRGRLRLGLRRQGPADRRDPRRQPGDLPRAQALYLGQAEPVPEAPYAVPLGRAAIRRPGTDVTIVATQMMVQQALQAATRLETDGISTEVIDPRTSSRSTSTRSLLRSGVPIGWSWSTRGWKFGGFGGDRGLGDRGGIRLAGRAGVPVGALDADAVQRPPRAHRDPQRRADRRRSHGPVRLVSRPCRSRWSPAAPAALAPRSAASWRPNAGRSRSPISIRPAPRRSPRLAALLRGPGRPRDRRWARRDGRGGGAPDGRLDVLVNCAAVAPAEAFLAMTAPAWEQALLVNVRAVALAIAAVAPIMQRQGGGRIINVTSAAARMALPDYAAYAPRPRPRSIC